LDSNDMKFFHPHGFVQPFDFSNYVAAALDHAALDQLIEEGHRGILRMLSIGLHLRICGRPARFRAVEAILADIKRRGPDVWVATRRQIAAVTEGQILALGRELPQ
jgi:hypothetical protein